MKIKVNEGHAGVMTLKDGTQMNYGVIRVTRNLSKMIFYTGKGMRELFKPDMTEEEKAKAAMDYRRFMMFNVVGAVAWVVLILPAGWFFGNLPWVKKNFELVVLGIIFVSVLPMVVEILREWRKRGRDA